MALALVQQGAAIASPSERVAAAVGFLLAFDCFGRASDIAQGSRSELRPPVAASSAQAAREWSLTLWPSTGLLASKTGSQDDTVTVATSHPARAWIKELLPLLLKATVGSDALLGMTPSRYKTLFDKARSLAGLRPCGPHALRHGGASMDADHGVGDLPLMVRGRWRALATVARYRRPAQYLRALGTLTQAQKDAALSAPSCLRRLCSDLPGEKVSRKRKR